MKQGYQFILLLLVSFGGFNLNGQVVSINNYDSIQASILTCDSGDLLYSLFGHTALRITDNKELDVVYNWGTFDFETPGFAIKFLRGKLPYALSTSSFNGFLREYLRDQRSVIEQKLNISNEEKIKLIKALQINQLQENRFYKYDFYFDNCTTRIRELIERLVGITSYGDPIYTNITFRNLLHKNLKNHPWTKFGMDLILGTLSDKKAGQEEQMFLPEIYFKYMEKAQANNSNVVIATRSILDFDMANSTSGIFTPLVVFSCLLLFEIIGFFLFYVSGDRGFLMVTDRFWFGALFLSSLILIFMWVGTDHEVCRNNWNLLWASPWTLLYFTKSTTLRKLCFSLTILGSVVVLFNGNMLPQQLPSVSVLIALICILKSLRLLGIVKWVDQYRRITSIITLILLSVVCGAQKKIGGITVVAPPKAFESDPFDEIKKVHANWAALVPYGYSRSGEPEVRFGSARQWWGEREEGIRATLELARKNQIQVLLKPQVWIPGGWVGEMDFNSEIEWERWEASYQKYIMTFVEIAIEYDVAMLCIGTEYRISVLKREKFWRSLIKLIREKFKGLLTYSANWDSYTKVPFWDELDHIGISAYFPLSDIQTPSELLLSYKWKKYVKKLKQFSNKLNKTILFTEFGYLSVDGAAGKTWELEKKVSSRDINEIAQANSYDALLKAFSKEEFWAGGFLWKWFPEGKGHEGYPERDYTPQDKLAQRVIEKWYRSFQ